MRRVGVLVPNPEDPRWGTPSVSAACRQALDLLGWTVAQPANGPCAGLRAMPISFVGTQRIGCGRARRNFGLYQPALGTRCDRPAEPFRSCS